MLAWCKFSVLGGVLRSTFLPCTVSAHSSVYYFWLVFKHPIALWAWRSSRTFSIVLIDECFSCPPEFLDSQHLARNPRGEYSHVFPMQNIYAKTAPRLPQRVLAFVQSLSLRGWHLEVPPGLRVLQMMKMVMWTKLYIQINARYTLQMFQHNTRLGVWIWKQYIQILFFT